MCMKATEILTNLLTPSSCELIYQLIVFQLVEIFYNLFMEYEGLLSRSREQNVIPHIKSQATSHYPILLFNISFNIIFQIPYLNSQATSHYPILLFNISFNIIFQIPYLNSQATSHYPILLFNISFNIIFQSARKSSNLFIFFKFSDQMCLCNFCVSCLLHDPPINILSRALYFSNVLNVRTFSVQILTLPNINGNYMYHFL